MADSETETLAGSGPADMVPPSGAPRVLMVDHAEWDPRLRALGGQLHQSWRWGEFQQRHGSRVERIAIESDAGAAMAQVLFKERGPVTTAFVPRGPMVSGDAHAVLPALWRHVGLACRRHRALFVNVEPECELPPAAIAGAGPVFGGQRFTPKRTVMVPLADDETLLRQMHASKRREVRKAERRGITITDGSHVGLGIEAFYGLMVETSQRNQIRINSQNYYADFLRLHGGDTTLLLAIADGKVAAGLIMARFGDTATYLFGGSSTAHRVPGATAYLQYAAMRWARERGCTRYDLWGIPDEDPPTYVDADGTPIRSVGDSSAGLYRFKVELGGSIVSYPESFEMRYRPGLSWAMRRMKGLTHALRA